MRKAVYFFCTDYERDEVAPRVLNYLKENYDLKLADFKFANRDVYEYHDDRGNLFSFVETDKVLSYDYDLYIPLLNKYFKDIFISEEIGYQKPKIEFFDYCFRHIEHFDKDKALIIGDSLTSDMQGGINAQIDTCWYNPQHDKTSIKIDYIIHDLKELENML